MSVAVKLHLPIREATADVDDACLSIDIAAFERLTAGLSPQADCGTTDDRTADHVVPLSQGGDPQSPGGALPILQLREGAGLASKNRRATTAAPALWRS